MYDENVVTDAPIAVVINSFDASPLRLTEVLTFHCLYHHIILYHTSAVFSAMKAVVRH
jgi:hypothetical protein